MITANDSQITKISFSLVKVQKKIIKLIFEVLTAPKFKSFQENPKTTLPFASMGRKGVLSSIYYQKDIIMSPMIMKTTKNRQNPKNSVKKSKKVSEPFES